MKFDKEDPRITAFALGEPLNEADQKYIDSLKSDEFFNTIVEEIRSSAEAFSALFHQESSGENLVEVTEILDKHKVSVKVVKFPLITWETVRERAIPALAGIAAVGVIAALLIPSVGGVYNRVSKEEMETRQVYVDATIPEFKPVPRISVENESPAQGESLKYRSRHELLAESQPSSSASGNVEWDMFDQTQTEKVDGRLGAVEVQRTGVDSNESVNLYPGKALTDFSHSGSLNERNAEEEVSHVKPAWVMPLAQEDPENEALNREGYDRIVERKFLSPTTEPLSTFSIDVDTASYANVRRFIENGQMPPPDAVRIEELINYFDYDYPRPEKTGERIVPFTVNTDIMPTPWAPEHHLVRIGLQGYEIPWKERPASNLVFLVDVSGSMSSANKLDLVKQALTELIQKFDERDRVAIVTYAGSSGLALPSTTANNHATIEHALNNLQSGGSTNGAQGIDLAYEVAQQHFIEGGNNRVILCTDGDFNVGVSDRGSLTRLIEEKAKSGVFLSICGFGMGNYQDGQMEHLSNSGNGNYAYIDSLKEAQKVFGKDLTGTLIAIAKDVKIQVEFNPQHVQAYRLIGYENRTLANEDFNDDTKDAGEIGAGHSVTALYEIIPVGLESNADLPTVDALKYQTTAQSAHVASDFSGELMTVKLRYKAPDGDSSQLISEVVLKDQIGRPVSSDFSFISAVAEFGLLLQGSAFAPEASWEGLIQRTRESLASNPGQERSAFLNLAKQAFMLMD